MARQDTTNPSVSSSLDFALDTASEKKFYDGVLMTVAQSILAGVIVVALALPANAMTYWGRVLDTKFLVRAKGRTIHLTLVSGARNLSIEERERRIQVAVQSTFGFDCLLPEQGRTEKFWTISGDVVCRAGIHNALDY